MKKVRYYIITMVFSAIFIAGCVTTGNGDLLDLDNAIKKAADEVSTDLPQGTTVAVVMFDSSSIPLSEYIIEELSLALSHTKKLVIVDRKQLELIRNEANFQMSGEVDDDSVVRIGHLLGAQFIITGSLIDSGTYYRFRSSAVNVENAVREAPVSLRITKSDKQISYLGKSDNQTVKKSPFEGKWKDQGEFFDGFEFKNDEFIVEDFGDFLFCKFTYTENEITFHTTELEWGNKPLKYSLNKNRLIIRIGGLYDYNSLILIRE